MPRRMLGASTSKIGFGPKLVAKANAPSGVTTIQHGSVSPVVTGSPIGAIVPSVPSWYEAMTPSPGAAWAFR